MLIRKDQGFEHRSAQGDAFLGKNASIIQHIVETGTITAELKDHFPSEDITNPNNFVSLLYYFGMLSIADEYQEEVVFRIPNQVVREQMYGYLTRAYQENDLSVDEYRRSKLMSGMAWEGNWRPFFDYIAETLRRFSSQRDKAKGEAYVHGFTLAQTCLSNVYLPISELDAGPKSVIYSEDAEVEAGGYADIYLQPLLGIYPNLKHSYVIELKYLPGRATDADVARTREKAIAQLTRYAEAVAIESTYKPTTLHRLVLLWRGMELAVAEEL